VNPACIWLVDDTESNRRLYGDILTRSGYQVVCFENGIPAIARAREATPELVLLDVRMPEMDGFEVCDALRGIWGVELVPIVMLTAFDDRESYIRGLEAGAHDYLVQPVDIEHLRVRVRSLLRLREMHLELQDAKRRLSQRVDLLNNEAAERERQLVMADRLATLGQMAAAIAHEINNPLTYVSANANYCRSIMNDRLGDDPDWSAAMQAVVTGIERIREVIHDVQMFSRTPATEGRADVRKVIESAASMARHAFRHCAELTRKIEEGPLWAAIPQSRFAQALLNLFVNAAHACEDRDAGHGTITVTARRDGDNVVLEVTDTGGGIPEGRLEDIFKPFYTSKAEGRGTGLGLSICRDFLERAGGSISVSSVLGQGSTFLITVPAASAPAPKSARVSRVRRESVHPPVVVIVDDEPLVAFALARMLSGYHVRTFAAVDDALNDAATADAILCDLMMPDKGGIELYQMLDETQRRRMVFVTGGAYRQREVDFLKTIPNRTLDKPVFRADLRDSVAKLVAETSE